MHKNKLHSIIKKGEQTYLFKNDLEQNIFVYDNFFLKGETSRYIRKYDRNMPP